MVIDVVMCVMCDVCASVAALEAVEEICVSLIRSGRLQAQIDVPHDMVLVQVPSSSALVFV